MLKSGVNGVTDSLGNTSPENHSTMDKLSKKNRWCFTFNNYSDDEHRIMVQWCNIFTKAFIIGKEVGEKGTPHLQGYFNLKKQMRFTELKKVLSPKIHLESCKGNEEDNYNYCSKSNDYIQQGLDKYIKKVITIKTINTLRPFQEDLKNYILNNDANGKILWVYDPEGQLGKTEFLRYMFVNHKIPFSYGGKCADIINLVFNNKSYFLESEKPAIIYNFGRDTENDKISYKSMEQVADGCISNTKFEAGCFVCNKINVVVLANCLPIYSKMTGSRWITKTITNTFQLVDYKNELDV